MTVEAFQAWFFGQPELIQKLVIGGPPFLVMLAIGLALGTRFRFLLLSWFVNPFIAPALMTLTRNNDDDVEPQWTRDAKASVDDLIARRNRRPY